MRRVVLSLFSLTLFLLCSHFVHAQDDQNAEGYAFIVSFQELDPYGYADIAIALDAAQVSIEEACIPIGMICFRTAAHVSISQALLHVKQVVAHETDLAEEPILRSDLNRDLFREACSARRQGVITE